VYAPFSCTSGLRHRCNRIVNENDEFECLDFKDLATSSFNKSLLIDVVNSRLLPLPNQFAFVWLNVIAFYLSVRIAGTVEIIVQKAR
jgi:hypothetical protein